MIKSQQI